MKLVLLAEPFHSFTLTERLDRNGIVGIFNERICPSSQSTRARIYCCKSPMKSLGLSASNAYTLLDEPDGNFNCSLNLHVENTTCSVLRVRNG